MSFFDSLSKVWGGVLSFVKVAAPVAEEVGSIVGNPAVVAGAKAAETAETIAENATATAVQNAPKK